MTPQMPSKDADAEIADLIARVEALEAAPPPSAGLSGLVVPIAKRVTTFPFQGNGSAQAIPDLVLALPGNGVNEMLVELFIPQFQVTVPVQAFVDIYFQIESLDGAVVYGAAEKSYLGHDVVRSPYEPVLLKAHMEPFEGTRDVRATITTTANVLEGGGYEDPSWRAPATLVATWL